MNEKERERKIGIIKDTILNYIVNEVEGKLKSKNVKREEIKEFLNLTQKKTNSIINSLDEKVLLPDREMESEKEFQEHILHVLDEIRPRLVKEIEAIKFKEE